MLVCIRGAGDLASGIAVRLFRARLRVVMTEIDQPLTVRRTVSFCVTEVRAADACLAAVRVGSCCVEGIRAELVDDVHKAAEVAQRDVIPVIICPDESCINEIKPDAVVDAIMVKKKLGTKITDAPAVIGVGPGDL